MSIRSGKKVGRTIAMVVLSMVITSAYALGFEWRAVFGEPESAEHCGAMQRTADGGYVISGVTFQSGATPDVEVYLIKTNKFGTQEWSRTYELLDRIELPATVKQTRDGGYILSGTSYLSGATTNPNVYLLKTDGAGNEEWRRYFGDAGVPTGFSGQGAAVQQTLDDGFVVAGTAFLSGATKDAHAFLIKTDVSGDLDWSRTLGNDISAKGYAVQQTFDGGYAVSGGTFVSGETLDADVFLTKTDESGIPVWTNYFGDAGHEDYGYDLLQADDGGYVIAGTSYLSGATTDADVFWLKTTPDGNLDGYQIYGDPGYMDTGYALQPTKDGGYVITGTTISAAVDTDMDAHIIKTDANGTLEWRRFFAGMDNDDAKAVQQADDGGYVIAGTSYLSGATSDPNIFLQYSQPLQNGMICPDPRDLDSDDDGISDEEEDENVNGIVDPGETDPCNVDTDGDGIQDGTESGLTSSDISADTDQSVFQPDEDPNTTTDPLNADTDNDGILDGEEDANYNGSIDGEETDPNVSNRPINLMGMGENDFGQIGAENTNRFSPVDITTDASQVAAGRMHSLFIKTDGTLWATGANQYGQLGDGTTTDRITPVQVATDVSQVVAGMYHSLFVKTDGTLWAMGLNSYGQLGDGATTNRSTPVQVATDVSQVAAGTFHSLFVKTDGTFWAMGLNDYGQLGDGTTTAHSAPVQVANGVSQVAAGVLHSLFLKTDSTLWAMGYNSNGQLGDGTTTDHSTPVKVAADVSQVAAGGYHSLFVKTDGTIWAMGQNSFGQLGDSTTTDRITPVQVASGVSRVTAGYSHSLFVKTDGALWAMGRNNNGQLGDGTTTTRTIPVQVDSDVSLGAAGYSHSLFVKTDGTLWAMGQNIYGQLGDGTTTNCITPVQAATNVSKAAAGYYHSLFVKTDGTLWAMGLNFHGELGDGTTAVRISPVQVATDVSQVAAGSSYSLFVKTDGTLWAMGYNYFGELGDGTTATRITPVQVATNASQVAAGCSHSLFVKTDGTLWAMGRNNNGQLGDGTTTTRITPVQIATGVSQAAAGYDHSLFVKTDGTLWSMGRSNNGQLGDGTTTNSSTPVQVATGVSQAAAGTQHSLFVKTDGTLWAMGANQYGQLGDGTTTTRLAPVKIATDVSQVAAGGWHSLFVKTAGTLWAMGRNNNGQLGDGTTTNRNMPVQIATDVLQAAAGGDPSADREFSLFLQSANLLDSDNDGLIDSLEESGCTNPLDADSDDDGLADGMEDANHNGLVDAGETDPCNLDTDGDGLQDGTEIGLTIDDVNFSYTDESKFQPDEDPTTTTYPTNGDSDGDEVKDGAEDADHNGRVDPGESDPNLADVTSALDDGPWPMFKRNISHTGLSSYTGSGPFIKWRYQTGKNNGSSPAIGEDGTVYVGSTDMGLYGLYAINPDGSLKFHRPEVGQVELSSPAIGKDGLVYVGSMNQYSLFSIDLYGNIAGQYLELNSVASSPAIGSDGTIYFGTFDYLWANQSYFYAVSSFGGYMTMKWRYPMGPVTSSPCISSGGVIYVGSWDNNLYAFYNDGTLKWKFNTGEIAPSSPTIAGDGTIYIGAGKDLFAINANGLLKWKFSTESTIVSSPSIDLNDVIYLGSSDKNLYAINSDGTLEWRFLTGGSVDCSPAVGIDGTIYIGSSDGYLYAINDEGSLKWRLRTGDMVRSSPSISDDGTVYIGSWDNYLYAIGLPEGKGGTYGRVVNQSDDTGIEGATITIGSASTSSDIGGDYSLAQETGIFEITCSKPGYETTIISDVSITVGEAIKLDISLTPSSDGDNDGLPDWWETENGLNPNDPNDASLDADNDGLNNLYEYLNGTNPQKKDTDNDGMPDGWEVDYGLDPNIDDSAGHADSDTLTNLQEYQYQTDPTNEDTDGDGISDSDEVANGTDPRAMRSSLTSVIEELNLPVGSNQKVLLRLENTSRDSDSFVLGITGIDPSWFTLDQNELILAAGEIREIGLHIHIPDLCGLTPLVYTIHASADSPTTGLVANGGVDISLTIRMAPVISELLPESGEKLATNAVVITWRTDVEATTDLYYRVSGTGTFNQAAGVSGTNHKILLEGLTWNTTYEYYALSRGACDKVQSEVRTLHVENGVVFVERSSTHEILRDYDQRGSLSVQNIDAVSHTVLVQVINPYEDLIAGFVASGSEDQAITLDPGESRDVILALHAQDSQENEYTLSLKLTADADTANPIVDYTSAIVSVRDPVFDLDFSQVGSNPAIFTNTYRIINNGDTVTDLRVFAEETVSPQIVFQPRIDHLRLTTGQSVVFSATYQPLDGESNYDGLLMAQAAGQTVTLDTHFGCSAGTSLYDVTLNDAHLCMRADGWYCTNKPNINFNMDIPRGIAQENVNRARLYINFSLPWERNTYRNHNVTVKLNGTTIQSFTNTIPSGPYGVEIPPALLRTGANSVGRNTLELITTHMNRGHYVVATDFQLIVDVDAVDMGAVCATSQEEADLAALDFPFLCSGTPDWPLCPIVNGVTTLDANGSPTSVFNPGDTVQLRVSTTNPDLDDQSGSLHVVVDDDFGEGTVVFEQTVAVDLIAGGSGTFAFSWQIPENTNASFYHVETSLSGLGDCQDETTNWNLLSIFQPVEGYAVSPSVFDFGKVVVSTQQNKTFLVQNTGNVDLVLGELSIAGSDELILVNDTCSQATLAPGATCSFATVFSPAAEAIYSVRVAVPSVSPSTQSIDVPIIGAGLALGYESPRLLTTQWRQYQLQCDSDNDGNPEQYVPGCTSVAVGQLINYYLDRLTWFDSLLKDMVVYPRFTIEQDQQPDIRLFTHPGCQISHLGQVAADEDQVFDVTMNEGGLCVTNPSDPVVSAVWNVAIGCDASFVSGEKPSTGVGSYGLANERYDWVDNPRQKIKSLLIDRFWFNRSIEVSEELTALDDERAYITSSIDRGDPVLISMYGPHPEDPARTAGHTAVIDQYRIEADGNFQVRINMGWGVGAFQPGKQSDIWYDGSGSIDAEFITFETFYIYKYTVPIEDTDGDGMPNDWEQIHDLDPIHDDADQDPDGDGLTNLEEYHNGTHPHNPDTDGDGISDGDEVNHNTDPNALESIDILLETEDVTVSLTGGNQVFVEVENRFCTTKNVNFGLTGLDASWYSISPQDQSFTLNPFGRRVVAIQLDLPQDCGILAQDYPFQVQVSWEAGGANQTSEDFGTLVVTSQPNVYPLAIPGDTHLAGNTIIAAWKTDVPTDGFVYYRQLGDEEFVEVPLEMAVLEHRATITDLDYFTYYEFYTESRSACGETTISDINLVRTGKAVKFEDGVNEFSIDRDYDQSVTLTVKNTDILDHAFLLSVINDNPDIVVGFVGDGMPSREATLLAGDEQDVELVVHANDALKTDYNIYLKMVSDEGSSNSFVDFLHVVIHVRPFVANLDIQPVESAPGMMTSRFRLINYGDPLSDIAVYVDETSSPKVTVNPAMNHYRMDNGDSVEFNIQAQEYTTGTLYARSGTYVVSTPFEIGCPPNTELNTYTVDDVAIVAEIKDWYCTNKMDLELPFAVPNWFGQNELSEAALEVNFSLPMDMDKYDPHTVVLSINGETVATLRDTIPQGLYTFRFPTSLINLGADGPAGNRLQVHVEGITEGQYIVATDFKVILNVDQIQVDLCVTPPPDWFPPKQTLPVGVTTITGLGPARKSRPGEVVDVVVGLSNSDSPNRPAHNGILTLTMDNNSNPAGNRIQPNPLRNVVSIAGGQTEQVHFSYKIPENADDIDYTLSATFENMTLGTTESLLNQPGFWVRTPLIIVHGIMGSRLVEKEGILDDVVWGGLKDFVANYIDYERSFEKLPCNGSGNSINPVVATRTIKQVAKYIPVINKFFGVDVFDGLERYLREECRYNLHEIGSAANFDFSSFNLTQKYPEDIFYFVYDWRMDNGENAAKLKQFIDKITDEQFSGVTSTKVNIIAHSMGGLVLKSMLLDDDDIREKLRKVVFVGTPHLGAVEAFNGLKYGVNNFDIDEQTYRDIGMNFSSVYQLLPSDEYYNYYSHYYELNGSPIDLNSTPSMMGILTGFSNIPLLNESRVFHSGDGVAQGIDGLDFSSLAPMESYIVAGCKVPTLTLVKESLDSVWTENGDGDETVPLGSALAANVNKKYAVQYGSHSNLPSIEGVSFLIRALLKGYNDEFPEDSSHPVANYSQDFCGLPSGTRITIITPPGFRDEPGPDEGEVTIWPRVYKPSGKHEPGSFDPGSFTGITGNEVHTGILGSDYQSANNGVVIFVPEGDVYQVEFKGVDSDYLNIKYEFMTEGGVIRTVVFGHLILDGNGCGNFVIDLTDIMTNPVLRLDYECDDQFDEENIPPSYELDESESADNLPPVTTANVSGTLGQNGWYTSDVSITLNTIDQGGSGLMSIKYRLNGNTRYFEYSEPIVLSSPGEYTLYYYAIDRNLNSEIEHAIEIKIEDIVPQVLSVTDAGYFNLGLADLSATVETLVGSSGLQEIQYSIGTAPGLGDIRDWTSGGTASQLNITGLTLVESCVDKVYVNVRIVNGAGVTSEVVSSDGVIMLEPGGDPDSDGHINEAEIAAGSNPCNADSIPKDTTITLAPGFNMIAIPADVTFSPDLRDWLPLLGTADDIETVMVYDPANSRYITLIPGGASNPAFQLSGGEGLIIYAKREHEIVFTSALCGPVDVRPGLNTIGFACAPDSTKAFALLLKLGSENAISIQRYETETGKFKTAAFNDAGELNGEDFAIIPGEGYFLNMRNTVSSFELN